MNIAKECAVCTKGTAIVQMRSGDEHQPVSRVMVMASSGELPTESKSPGPGHTQSNPTSEQRTLPKGHGHIDLREKKCFMYYPVFCA